MILLLVHVVLPHTTPVARVAAETSPPEGVIWGLRNNYNWKSSLFTLAHCSTHYPKTCRRPDPELTDGLTKNWSANGYIDSPHTLLSSMHETFGITRGPQSR